VIKERCGAFWVGWGGEKGPCVRVKGHKAEHRDAAQRERDKARNKKYYADQVDKAYNEQSSVTERPPKPEPLACKHCGGPGRVTWTPCVNKWQRAAMCQYGHAAGKHGMTCEEKRSYLAAGCYVVGCSRVATDIDHDHNICPVVKTGVGHSCDKCRRGPLCSWHNNSIMPGVDHLLSLGVMEFRRSGFVERIEVIRSGQAVNPLGAGSLQHRHLAPAA
jgi:hypothetical protein